MERFTFLKAFPLICKQSPSPAHRNSRIKRHNSSCIVHKSSPNNYTCKTCHLALITTNDYRDLLIWAYTATMQNNDSLQSPRFLPFPSTYFVFLSKCFNPFPLKLILSTYVARFMNHQAPQRHIGSHKVVPGKRHIHTDGFQALSQHCILFAMIGSVGTNHFPDLYKEFNFCTLNAKVNGTFAHPVSKGESSSKKKNINGYAFA